MITASEIINKYISFFEEKGHKKIPSAPLVPEDDPTTLFISAGMHPLVPYLLGQTHPLGKRLVSVQKCLRTDDIDEVGDKVHHTFFEMLGNWSLGDYFKKEAIEWSFEFLTSKKWLGIDKNKLAISVFQGDADAPFDEESYQIWTKLGIPKERIARLSKKNNWWGPPGQTGPCGPDTEVFVWVGKKETPKNFDVDDPNWVEIWNDVFMQYYKDSNGKFELLKQKNVDTGMGLERILTVLNGSDDDYQTELYLPIIKKIEEISGKKYIENKKAFRVIVDHLKAAVFILSEGVYPSNVGRGYIPRRLIRRVVRYGKVIGIEKKIISEVSKPIFEIYKNMYPKILESKHYIIEGLANEETKFIKTLNEGLKKANDIFEKKIPISNEIYSKIMQIDMKGEILESIYHGDKTMSDVFPQHGIPVSNKAIYDAYITGEEAFYLYQTYGFPIEMIMEFVQAKKLFVAINDFRKEVKKHQELSRTASAGMFKGGLVDNSEIAVKYHTATHLLHAASRQIFGKHVEQKGSNITSERLRFDFSHPNKLTDEEIKKIEDLVNEKIQENLKVTKEIMDKETALKSGALGFFAEKYGDKVTVYSMGSFSREICGGPHVDFTGMLKRFKIIKQENIGHGQRRIYAVLEN